MKGILALLVVCFAAAAVSAENGCPQQQVEDWSIERLLPHPVCNRFYKCTYGVPVEQNCPENLNYNIETEQCDYEENVDCKGRISKVESKPDVDKPESAKPEDNGSDNAESEEADKEEENNNKPDVEENSCPSDWWVERLLPHPECRKFFNCANGKPVALSCPPNLYYNIEKEQCDYSENVDCGDRIKGQESDSAEGQDDGNDGDNESVAEIEFLPNRCPVDENIHWLIPGENCNEFYYCVKGEKQIRVCSAGLEFNPVLQVCDWAASAGCTKSANKHASTRRKILGY